MEDFRTILRAGADKISINSSALNTPDLISDAAYKFGSQCVVVAIDAKKRADGSGWNVYKTAEGSTPAEMLRSGHGGRAARRRGILLTSMDGRRDEGRI